MVWPLRGDSAIKKVRYENDEGERNYGRKKSRDRKKKGKGHLRNNRDPAAVKYKQTESQHQRDADEVKGKNGATQ
jgi:hypothetical protein